MYNRGQLIFQCNVQEYMNYSCSSIYGTTLSNSCEVWTMCRADETRLLSDEMQFGTVTHFSQLMAKLQSSLEKYFIRKPLMWFTPHVQQKVLFDSHFHLHSCWAERGLSTAIPGDRKLQYYSVNWKHVGAISRNWNSLHCNNFRTCTLKRMRDLVL